MATPSSRLNANAIPWDPSQAFPSAPAAAAECEHHSSILSRSSSDISLDKHISPLSLDVYGARKNSPIIAAAVASNYATAAGDMYCAAPPGPAPAAEVPSPPRAPCFGENEDEVFMYEPPQRSGVVQIGMAIVPDQYAHDEHYIMHVLQADELANTEPYEPDFDSDEDSLDDEQMAWLEEQLRAKEDTYEEIFF